MPWHIAPPTNKFERNVCGIRSEFNIAHGFGYAAKGHEIRESLAFGGDVKDKNFYKNFIYNLDLFTQILNKMRMAIFIENSQKTLIEQSINVHSLNS